MEIFNSYRYKGGVKRKDRTRRVNFKAICVTILFEFLRGMSPLERDSNRVRVRENGRGGQMHLRWGRRV